MTGATVSCQTSKPDWSTFCVLLSMMEAKKGVTVMTLGNRIYELRTARNLSQGDLAEALDVSRQSVSKWETDASVPELHKLVKLCELFEISLDELVRGEERADTAVGADAVKKPWLARMLEIKRVKIALILLALSFVVRLFGPFGIMLGVYILLPCAILALVLTRKSAFWVCWGVLLVFAVLCAVMTGIRPWWIFTPDFYRDGMVIHIIIAWVEVLAFLAMAVWTVRKIVKRKHTECVQ